MKRTTSCNFAAVH